MLIGRYGVIVPVLALAGSYGGQADRTASLGTFPTGAAVRRPSVGVIVIFGGLTFFPALALGPIVEHLALIAGQTFASGRLTYDLSMFICFLAARNGEERGAPPAAAISPRASVRSSWRSRRRRSSS